MRCEEVQEAIVAWLDGEERQEERLRAHLTACSPCREELRLLCEVRRAAEGVLRLMPGGQSETGFAVLLERVEAETAAHTRGDRQSLRLGGRPADERRDGGTLRPGLGLAEAARRRRARLSGSRRPAAKALRWVAAAALGGVGLAAALSGGRLGTRVELSRSGGPAEAPEARLARSTENGGAEPLGAEDSSSTRRAQGWRDDGRTGANLPAHDAATMPVEMREVPSATHDLQVPDEVRIRPGLFLDLPVVQRLEKLRHLEALSPESHDSAAEGEAG